MRIIAGQWRSRKIVPPPSSITRPMPDRIREAIFDILSSRLKLPGTLPPIRVADLFAGSGSMGLEAISRGVEHCDFVERNSDALTVIRKNVLNLEAGDRCRVLRADGWTIALASPKPLNAYGLIFVDPPFVDARDTTPKSRINRLFSDLYRAGWADSDTLIVLHHEAIAAYQPADQVDWSVLDRRVYGIAAVTIIGHAGNSQW